MPNNAVRTAVVASLAAGNVKPRPKGPDDRLVKCAVRACQNRIPAARIFCRPCTNRLRPELLQAIADAYRRGAPAEEKKRLILKAADSLRTKKTRKV